MNARMSVGWVRLGYEKWTTTMSGMAKVHNYNYYILVSVTAFLSSQAYTLEYNYGGKLADGTKPPSAQTTSLIIYPLTVSARICQTTTTFISVFLQQAPEANWLTLKSSSLM